MDRVEKEEVVYLIVTDNGMVEDADAGSIGEKTNLHGYRKTGGVIPILLFLSTKMDNCKDENYKDDDRDIYNNGNDDYIIDHDYRVEGRSLVEMVTLKVKAPARYEVLDRQILEGGKCSTRNESDDNNDINKSDVSPSGLPHGAATGPTPRQILANGPPDI